MLWCFLIKWVSNRQKYLSFKIICSTILDVREIASKIPSNHKILKCWDYFRSRRFPHSEWFLILNVVFEKSHRYDYKRSMAMFVMGSTYIAPLLHFEFTKVLPQLVRRVAGSTERSFKTSLVSMLIHQIVFDPFITVGFFIYHGWVQDRSMQGIRKGVDNLKSKFVETMITSWKIFPLSNLFNFRFVPIQYQVLFSNFIGFLWNIYLSFITYRWYFIINQCHHQNALVETIAPKTDSMFSFTVSSVVSEICLLGSIFPVFFIASYFLFFFVSSSILFPHSKAHFPIFSKFSWLCSTTSDWFLNFSPLFHFCLYRFNNIFCSSSLVL